MAYAEDASVPEAGAEMFVHEETCGLHGYPFGSGVVNGGAHAGLLSRLGSRKRLCPTGLIADADNSGSAHGDGEEPWGIADDPPLQGLLLAYRSCPVFDRRGNSYRAPPRLRAISGMRGVSLTNATGSTRKHGNVPGIEAPITSPRTGRPLATSEFPPEQGTQSGQEVPVLVAGAADILAAGSATTAGSAFATAATSAGHMPPAPSPRSTAPYSELLSGPCFSYAADGDGVFQTGDAISLGSIGSGGDAHGVHVDYQGSDCYDKDDDRGDDDDDKDDEDDSEFNRSVHFELHLSGTARAGITYSGSGERFPGLDAAAAAAVPSNAHRVGRRCAVAAAPAAAGACGAAAGQRLTHDESSGCAGEFTSNVGHQLPPPVAVVAAERGDGRFGPSPAVTAAVGGYQALWQEEPEGGAEGENDVGDVGCGLPLRSGSSESVGSADFEAPSRSSRAPARISDRSAGPAVMPLPPPPMPMSPPMLFPPPLIPPLHAVVRSGAFAPPLAPGGVHVAGGLQAVAAAAAVGGSGGSGGAGPFSGVHQMLNDPAPRPVSDATGLSVPPPPPPPPPPGLLPPEVYLGFVNQLVESVRTATMAVDNAAVGQAELRRAYPGGGYAGGLLAAHLGRGLFAAQAEGTDAAGL